jgi:hypothetical protein
MPWCASRCSSPHDLDTAATVAVYVGFIGARNVDAQTWCEDLVQPDEGRQVPQPPLAEIQQVGRHARRPSPARPRFSTVSK